MKLENVKVADLKPLERNIRQHPEAQIKELMKSLNQFQQTRALVVDENNTILVGNGLFEAMKRLEYKECAVYRVIGLSEKDKKKLIISDNKTFDLGLNNFEEIQNYIEEITFEGDFDIAGFDEAVLKEMTRSLEKVEEEMMNYGVASAPVVEAIKSAATPSSQPSESNPVSAPTPTPHAQAPQVEKAAVETTRKIVCPSCGEVIYID